MNIKERIRRAIVKAADSSGLSRGEFSERANILVPSLFAYMSESTDFRTPNIETLVRIALASKDPEGFMISLLPSDAESRREWTQADKSEALKATESMAREIARSMKEAKREEEAFNKLHSGFAACYLMSYDARVKALRGRGE